MHFFFFRRELGYKDCSTIYEFSKSYMSCILSVESFRQGRIYTGGSGGTCPQCPLLFLPVSTTQFSAGKGCPHGFGIGVLMYLSGFDSSQLHKQQRIQQKHNLKTEKSSPLALFFVSAQILMLS